MPHARNGNAQCHCSGTQGGSTELWYHSCSCVAIGQWGFLRLATRVNLFLIENVIDLMWEEPYLNTGRPSPLRCGARGNPTLSAKWGTKERGRSERRGGIILESPCRTRTLEITPVSSRRYLSGGVDYFARCL